MPWCATERTDHHSALRGSVNATIAVGRDLGQHRDGCLARGRARIAARASARTGCEREGFHQSFGRSGPDKSQKPCRAQSGPIRTLRVSGSDIQAVSVSSSVSNVSEISSPTGGPV